MQSPLPLWSLFFAVLRGPRLAMDGVAKRADMREGRAAILVLAALHALFSLVLHVSGHAPRMGIPGLGPQSHYLHQAIFIVPLYLVLFWVGGLVAFASARRLLGSGSRDASLAVFGVAYAIPMTVLFIVPDVVVFSTLGFGAIGKAMRWYAPIAALACVWLAAMGLSRVHTIGTGRATIAAFVGFLTQAIVGGFFLR